MILVYIEVREGKVKKYSLEALSEAKRLSRDLGTEMEAVIVGHELSDLAEEVRSYGTAKTHVLSSPLLSRYSPSGYAFVLKQLVDNIRPEALIMAGSSLGNDLAPRLAARLGTGLISDAVQTAINDGSIEVLRPIYAGKALMRARVDSSPPIITLRPNVFPLEEKGSPEGEVTVTEVSVPEDQTKDRVAEVLREEGAALDVTEADIIVSGGRGMKGPENFDLLRDLADIRPQAAVGASRSAVDADWIDHQHQVGQTGKTVSPNLYMAFGISGAIQHVAGMSSSKVIVAVNKDPEAPILKIADFGVVGDLFQVIPPLKEELKKILAE
jgi:electron transfer flavoprotein alpha subunit